MDKEEYDDLAWLVAIEEALDRMSDGERSELPWYPSDEECDNMSNEEYDLIFSSKTKNG